MIAIKDSAQPIDPDASHAAASEAPKWMSRVLIAAAVYNLLWGAFAVISPMTLFEWFGFDPLPQYPELWQCIGMIVGVYGIGYAIAARDPHRHWPIVLVGLLGKVLGPIGFVSATLSGRLPLTMGWTIVTNDLIWWIPFAMILWGAARANQTQQEQLTIPAPRAPIDPLGRMLRQYGSSLNELSRRQPVLVVLLRHSGCTFCRETLGDLAEQRTQIEAGGAQIALVHMGQSEPEELLDRYGLSDLHRFRDPMCHLYDLFGLKLGGFRQLFGPKVWIRAARALKGHGIGTLNGNGFRMPGAFLLYKGEPVKAFRHKTAADRPDYVELANLPEGCELSMPAARPRLYRPSTNPAANAVS